MATLNLNMPRYFIHARLGDRELGIYSAMAYATVPMILVSDSLGHSVVPRLARFYAGARLAEYRALLLKMLAIGACLGIAGLAGARLLGARLLGLFFGTEYAAHSRTFMVLILAAAIYCVACMFTSAITSARAFHDPAANLRSGSGLKRTGLRDLGAGRRPVRRRRGDGCRGDCASCSWRLGG